MHLGYLLNVVLLLLFAETLFGKKVISFNRIESFQEKNSYDPPSYTERAKRARYMMHNIDWVTIATISSQFDIVGLPFSNVASFTDGPDNNSTGIPYFYVPENDASVKDAEKNNNISITVSEMETPYCKEHDYIAELPPCARLTLCGQFEKLSSADEIRFAKNALFTRFPVMKMFPESHVFFFAKVNIKLIWMIDYYGKAYLIPIEDYFKANPLL